MRVSRRRGVGPTRRGRGNPLPFNPRRAYGSDLLLWLRDSQGYTLSTVGEWKDQSLGLRFAESTQSKRPVASSGAAVFDGISKVLSEATPSLAPGAWEVWFDYKLNALPGAGILWSPLSFLQGAGGVGTVADFLWYNQGGYQPFQWSAKAGGSLGVGFADALDTSRHVTGISYNNGAISSTSSYLAWHDWVSKTLVAGGVQNNAGALNFIGARATTAYFSNMTMYQTVVFKRQLTTAERTRIQDWFTNATPSNSPAQIALDGGSAADLVIWLRPGIGQSGDVSAWADQGPAGNNVTQATLAQQPYFDLDDSVGDLRPSVVNTAGTAGMTHADIAAIGGATAFTWAAWVRKTGTTRYGLWVQAEAAPQYCFWTAANPAGAATLDHVISTNGTAMAKGNIPWTSGAWQHLAIVFDGAGAANADRLKMYLGGVAQVVTYTGTVPAALYDSSDIVRVLSESTTGGIDGRMDDIVWVKRALSPSQVAQLSSYYTRNG